MSEYIPKNKAGLNILMAGATGSGKTPIAQRLMTAADFINNIVYNPNRNYSEKYSLFFRFITFKMFLDSILKRQIEVNRTFTNVEDVSPFIKGNVDDDTRYFLSQVEHQNNVNVFQYHSIRLIPPDMFDFCHYLIWLQTNDDEQTVRQKRSTLLPFFHVKGDRIIELNRPSFIGDAKNDAEKNVSNSTAA